MKFLTTEYCCKTCNKPFVASIYAPNRADFTGHCSPRCRWNDLEQQSKTRRPGTWYKVRTIVCKGCNKTVTGRFPVGKKYCSHKCFCNFISLKHAAKRVTTCQFCKKSITKPMALSQLKIYKHSFCGVKCHNEYQKIDVAHVAIGIATCLKQSKRVGLNSLELAGREILKSLGFELRTDFKEQHVINKRFVVDVFLPAFNVIIEWDGDYWHGNPKRHKSLNKMQLGVQKKDKAENAYLTTCGYTVLRFWENDVINSPKTVLTKLKKVLGL